MSRRPRCFSGPFRIAAAALLALGILGACSSDDGEDSSGPHPTTTSTAAGDDELALRQLTQDWFDARSAVLYDDADVVAAEGLVQGRYLVQFEDFVADFREGGQELRRGDATREVVVDVDVDVDGDDATVRSCFVDADALIDETGTVLNQDVGTTHYETQAVRTAEGWRFTHRQQDGGTEEGDHCDEP